VLGLGGLLGIGCLAQFFLVETGLYFPFSILLLVLSLGISGGYLGWLWETPLPNHKRLLRVILVIVGMGLFLVGIWRLDRALLSMLADKAVCESYAVDTDRVIIGGFSAGGHMAMTLLLAEDEAFPVRGFVVLCPPVPEDYPPEAVALIATRGQRGLFLTTEMDNRVEDQRKLAAAFEAGGVPLKFEVTPNIGHWYPPDLVDKIDEAINFILK
jgi:pimeloyl-ACP methyl ester carboxylesterase